MKNKKTKMVIHFRFFILFCFVLCVCVCVCVCSGLLSGLLLCSVSHSAIHETVKHVESIRDSNRDCRPKRSEFEMNHAFRMNYVGNWNDDNRKDA